MISAVRASKFTQGCLLFERHCCFVLQACISHCYLDPIHTSPQIPRCRAWPEDNTNDQLRRAYRPAKLPSASFNPIRHDFCSHHAFCCRMPVPAACCSSRNRGLLERWRREADRGQESISSASAAAARNRVSCKLADDAGMLDMCSSRVALPVDLLLAAHPVRSLLSAL